MILKNILPMIVVSLVMVLLYAASKKKPKQDELGNIILQLPKFYPIVGMFTIIGGVGLMIFAVFFAKESDWILVLICSLLALTAGLYLFAKGNISHIKVTDLVITETSMFGKQNEIKWSEIKDLSFGKVSKELKISGLNKNIKAHFHLIGFQDLIAELENKTGKTIDGLPE